MIEEQLRATFERHEPQAPDVDTLKRAIDGAWVRRRQRRTMLRAGTAAVVVALAVAAVPLAWDRWAQGLGAATRAGASGDTVPAGPLDVLVLGLDPAEDRRSDTIMLVHIAADRHRAYLISFERDLLVDIPGHGLNKINMAYAFGGAQLASSLVKSLAGVDIDGTVTVSLGALRDITNVLDGVPICLPRTVTSVHTHRTYPVGCRQLDGNAAADLVRQRLDFPDGAYGRDRIAQRIMLGLVAKASDLNLLLDADKVLSMTRTTGVDVQLGSIPPVALAAQLHGLDSDDVVGLSSPSLHPVSASPGGPASFEELDPQVWPALVEALHNDTLDQFAAAHADWVLEH